MVLRNPIASPARAIAATAILTLFLGACADGGFTNNLPRWQGWGNQTRPAQPAQPAAAPATQAAPSEVQLACVQAAATRFGGQPGSIRPTASSLIRQDTFRVDLTTAGGPAVCLVDRGGNILSIQAAPAQPQSQQQNQRLL
ncbi:MAG: hypothetical protein AAGD23_01375 [Pseudomonadota bacterium]